VVGSIEEERQSGLKVEDLVTGVRMTLPAPGRCMMLIAPLTVWVPPTKSICEVKWATEREPISDGRPPA
jgi:hypothetical protein